MKILHFMITILFFEGMLGLFLERGLWAKKPHSSLAMPCRAFLGRRISQLLKNRRLRGSRIGIVVMTRQGRILFQHRANRGFIPASNIKIFTMATALYRLGASYRFETKLFASHPIDHRGVLRGDLFIMGSGDPLLRSEELWRIARDLRNAGLKRITGHIRFDDSFFDHHLFAKGWKEHRHHRFRPYLAATSALSLNFNTIAFTVHPALRIGQKARLIFDPKSRYIRKVINRTRTVSSNGSFKIKVHMRTYRFREIITVKGTVPLGHLPRTYWRRVSLPAWYAAFSFASFLRKEGIRVSPWPRRGRVPRSAVGLYVHRSPALGIILHYAGKESSNFVIEQILKTLGAEEKTPPGSWKKGIEVVQDFLKKVGISPKDYIMENASGIGRKNRVKPLQLAKVLRFMLKDFIIRPDFLAIQPIAGLDGTLKKRMKGRQIKGKLRAKTGTLDGVSALSGYAVTKDRKILIFSMLMNGRLKHNPIFRKIQDKIARLLVSCSWKRKR